MGEEENISHFLVFFAALLAGVLILSKYLHDSPLLSSVFPEAAMVLAVGMAAGFVIHLIVGQRNSIAEVAYENANDDADDDANDDDVYTREDLGALLSFNPDIFFIALLPPIIFNSGLRIGALFFRHFTPIAMFAIVGTTISALSVAFVLKLVLYLGLCNSFQPTLTELLTFGALISSTDPVSTLAVFQAKKVDPQLFYLVFGESVLNDALAIVLFESFSKFVAKEKNANTVAHGLVDFAIDLFLNSVGSLFLGCLGGLFAALIFKQIDMRQSRLVEISLYLLLMYIPFLLAEIMHLSGIVTILFTGITANRYVVPNLSSITKVNADMLFRLLSHLAETAIFLELGLSVFGLIGHWNWTFIMWSLLACFISRAMNVFPLVFVFNQCLLRDSDNGDDASSNLDPSQAFSAKVTPSMDLAEELGPDYAQAVDYGMMMRDAHQSFDQSVASEMTATPYHRKDLKIRPNTANMMWFSGLRGSVGYACVRTFPNTLGHQKEFTMTTMAIVLITVFVLGGTTEAALAFFNINIGVDEDTYMKQSLREPVISNVILTFERKYIKPLVIRDYHLMHGIRHHQPDDRASSHVRRRPRTPVDPTIEMTESGYLGTIQKKQDEDNGIDKLVRTDSLFDYGAN